MTTCSDHMSSVLLVDTDVDTRDMYQLAFTLEGFGTHSAASALDAFVAARDLSPAVIIADVGAPGRSHAFDLAAWLRRHEQTRNIPVVALTAYDLTTDAQRAPFARVLLKPVAPDALVAYARAAVSGAMALRDAAQCERVRVPDAVHGPRRARGRRVKPMAEHGNRLRCPQCKAVLTRSFARVRAGRARRHYGLCRNGCGVFYCDPDSRRTFPLSR
ncbi:MAG TPA: response regulator [Vicinamibacterales bacterium]|nr:response regulator [Vicinamibacterales bacterium]